MHIVALSVAVTTVLAALGVAAWTWQTLANQRDDFLELAGFGLPAED